MDPGREGAPALECACSGQHSRCFPGCAAFQAPFPVFPGVQLWHGAIQNHRHEVHPKEPRGQPHFNPSMPPVWPQFSPSTLNLRGLKGQTLNFGVLRDKYSELRVFYENPPNVGVWRCRTTRREPEPSQILGLFTSSTPTDPFPKKTETTKARKYRKKLLFNALHKSRTTRARPPAGAWEKAPELDRLPRKKTKTEQNKKITKRKNRK